MTAYAAVEGGTVNDELWKRVGYIAGRLSEAFPHCHVNTRSYDAGVGMVTAFSVWDDTESRSIADYMLTHAAIEDVYDVDILVQLIIHSAQSRS